MFIIPTESSLDLPKDIEAEIQVLGGIMIRPDIFFQISHIIKSEDFFLRSHQIIFKSLEHLIRESDSTTEIEPIRFIQYLEDHNKLEEVGGAEYIFSITDKTTSPTNAIHHAIRIHNFSVRRKLIQKLYELANKAFEPHENEASFIKTVEEELLKITGESIVSSIQPIESFKEEFLQYIGKLFEAKGGLTGQPTRFHELDRMTSGIRGGELILLAARPGMGKSTFALNISMNIAMYYQKPVIIFSLEMSRMELILRMLSAEAQINHSDLKRGHIPRHKYDAIKEAIARIFSSPIYIDDTGVLDIWDCIARTRKLEIELRRQGKEPGIVIIDYLQLLSDPETKKFGRQVEVASISRSLKLLAKKTNLPILALSQMNRSVEQRRGENARPQLSDLRESGALEQDADIVMFIHRETQFDQNDAEDPENFGRAEIIIAKHRNGPLGSFKLAYRPEMFRFDNLESF
ncbi:MAG: replicative DNA helicase [Leptospiraceae bacterium]|nr:replicative DNA helicase [Leptospiraceae bacterium]MDW7976723.1 replicative DNA helicase [Leptospiraceae bacterium]